MIVRRRLLASGAALLLSRTNIARAASYPSEQIKIVVPRAPGGGSDNLARFIQPGLDDKLGVTIVVENRPDATAIVGAIAVKKSEPDGYTYYLSDNSFYQNPAILDSLPYDTIKDFTAVTMIAQAPVILIVNRDVPAKDLNELLDLARRSNLTFSSGGVGSSTHLTGLMVNLKTGTNITHVPFRSAGPALTAVLGGHVSMGYNGLSTAESHIRQGMVRAFAITGDHRNAVLPDIPTFQECGIQGVDVPSIWGLHAPRGTPLEYRRIMRQAIADVMHSPALSDKIVELGFEAVCNTPEEHEAQTVELVNKWIEIGKKVNLKG